MLPEPTEKPSQKHFSSGPCAKIPGWSLDLLKDAAVETSHRAPKGIKKLSELTTLARDVLQIPEGYFLAMTPGSATGAIESAIWNLLGAQPLTVFSHDVFSHRWELDVVRHLNLANTDIRRAAQGQLPNCENIPSNSDVLLNWNGSTSGVRFPNTDFLGDNREGLVLADITSIAFTAEIPWEKFDAIAFSWQKGLGGEAAHGMLVLSPKAVERLNTYQPPWPLPYIFKLRARGEFYEPLFNEKILNTPSLLCVEDFIQSLKWAKSIGGLPALVQRSQDNFNVIEKWVQKTPWIDFLASDPLTRSTSTIPLKIIDEQTAHLSLESQWERILKIAGLLADRDIAHDIKNHPSAPPSLRIWGGPTMDSKSIEKLLPWIEWAYKQL